jgi:hypothetical protein
LDQIAFGILSALFLIQLMQIGLAYTAHDLLICRALYSISGPIDRGLLYERARDQASSAFEQAAPSFRAHKPELDLTPSGLRVEVLTRNVPRLRETFNAYAERVNEGIGHQRQSSIMLATFDKSRFVWLRPLDVASLVILLAGMSVWMIK